MYSIHPQQNLSLSKQELKINTIPLGHDLSAPYHDFSSNQISLNQPYTNGLNPTYNGLPYDYSSQFPSSNSAFSFSKQTKINPSNISHQTIQSSLFSCKQHKTKWTFEEDARLKDAVEKFGTDSWIRISQFVPGRNSKQCRERWMGQLAPSIRKDSWSREEDEILIHQHELIGNKWTAIATLLPGRSAINVKNRWSKIKRIKEDFLTNEKQSGSPSTQNINEHCFNNNNYSPNSIFAEFVPQKKNINGNNKKTSHKARKFKRSKISNSISRKQQKEKENSDNYFSSDEVLVKKETCQIHNNENYDINEKSSAIVFEFPTIDNVPLFGQDFIQFQAQMLK